MNLNVFNAVAVVVSLTALTAGAAATVGVWYKCSRTGKEVQALWKRK